MAAPSKPEKEGLVFARRGEIYLVGFDPMVGHEIRKTRPALIVQNDISNRYGPVTIVAAISSQYSDPPFPREIVIDPKDSGLTKSSAVILNQIRSVDRQRLIKRLGSLSTQTMQRVRRSSQISLGLSGL